MRHAFGMLVETAEAVSRPRPGVLLTGPAVGTPEPEQLVTVRGAFSTPTRSQLLAVVEFHRTRSVGKIGVVVPVSGAPPGTLIGGILYEEGALFRVFGAFINAAPRRAAARFVLTDGAASGLVRVQRNVIDAFVVGGGLAEHQNLWEELEQIRCVDAPTIYRAELQEPMGEAWFVPALQMYAQGNDTMIVAPPCGPATPNLALLSWDTSAVPANVRLQQSSGIVQVGVNARLAHLPRWLIGKSSAGAPIFIDQRVEYAE